MSRIDQARRLAKQELGRGEPAEDVSLLLREGFRLAACVVREIMKDAQKKRVRRVSVSRVNKRQFEGRIISCALPGCELHATKGWRKGRRYGRYAPKNQQTFPVASGTAGS